ncbi:MAG: hypothetical protein ACRDF4_11310, partial [Rhabdochlamydiaceae bacterium]
LAISFFSLSLDGLGGLPVLGDPKTPDTGFPVKYLKIVGRKTDTNDATSCDITILNTSSSLSAANLAVKDDGEENDYVSGQDHVKPGATEEVSVYGSNEKNPCKATFKINTAGIVK